MFNLAQTLRLYLFVSVRATYLANHFCHIPTLRTSQRLIQSLVSLRKA